MKRGQTEVETLRLNGWRTGDILKGDEGRGMDYILITAVGEERFLCRWLVDGKWGPESGSTTLVCRDWEKVHFEIAGML